MSRAISLNAANSQSPYLSTLRDLIQEAIVMLLALVLIALFAQNSSIMGILMCILIFGRFCLCYRRGDVSVFLFGLIAGGGNDLMSMWQGVYYYTPMSVLPLPIPLWMLFFWGQIFVSFRRLVRLPVFLERDAISSNLALALDLICLLTLRMIVYSFAGVPWLPEAIGGAVLLLRYLLLPPTVYERRLMLAILLIGPLYEIALIHAGLYVYQHGIVFGMPLWLLMYWAFIFRLLSDVISRMERRYWW